jgi:hypothetical protein
MRAKANIDIFADELLLYHSVAVLREGKKINKSDLQYDVWNVIIHDWCKHSMQIEA